MQPSSRRILFVAIMLAAVAWIWISRDPSATTTNGHITAAQQDFMAPEFSLQTLDGKTVTLSDLRGQAILVNFWATWCPPCKAEMPAMQKIYDDYKDQNFTILAINMTHQDEVGNIPDFLNRYGLSFPVLLEESGQVAKTYQVRSLPTSFFIDPDGIIQDIVIGGPMAEALLRSRVEQILISE